MDNNYYTEFDKKEIIRLSKKAPDYCKTPPDDKWLFYKPVFSGDKFETIMDAAMLLPVFIFCYPLAIFFTLVYNIIMWDYSKVNAYWKHEVNIADMKLVYIFHRKVKYDSPEVRKIYRDRNYVLMFMALVVTVVFFITYIISPEFGSKFLFSFFSQL